MRAEEERDKEQYERDRQKRKERWEEGRWSLVTGRHRPRLSSREPATEPSTPDVLPMTHPRPASPAALPKRETDRVPHQERPTSSMSHGPSPDTNGAATDADLDPPRNVSKKKNEAKPRQSTTAPAIPQEDARAILQTIQHALKQLDVEDHRQKDDSSLSHILQLIETGVSDPSTVSDELAQALSAEVRLEKVSLEDARYAERLDVLRERLGSLVTQRPQPDASNFDHDAVHEPEQEANTEFVSVARDERWSLATFRMLRIALLLFALAWAALRVMQCYADYLMMYTWYDPMYPAMYPTPEWAATFLPASLVYNVPFATSSRLSIAKLVTTGLER